MPLTRTDCMHVSDLPALDPECMTIRCRYLACTIQARKSHVDVYNTVLNVDDVPPINHVDRRREA
jgi:hypothetical protein